MKKTTLIGGKGTDGPERHEFRGAAAILWAITFLLPCAVSNGQEVENLVFTEISSTQLTESLDGVTIGNWIYSGSPSITFSLAGLGTPIVGGLSVLFPTAGYTIYEFLDPLNPGEYSDIYVSIGGVNTFYEGQTLNDAGLGFNYYSSQPVSDYIPNPSGFAPGYGLLVYTSDGTWVPVNITVQGVPEPSIGALSFIGGLGLFTVRRFKLKARATD